MEASQAKQLFWQGHVRAWRNSGQSQVAYSAEHGISSRRLSHWFKRERTQVDTLTLVPVSISPTQCRESLTLRGTGGWQLELPGTTPVAWLADLMGRLS